MTKQDKELLIKDLCARLPYGVKIKFNDGTDDVYNLDGNIHGRFTENVIQAIDDLELKPYLRPMSSMTDKERKEINELVESESSFLSPVPTWYVYEENIQKYVDFCLSHHLDWRDMIPKGLAFEAPEGMYNFK